MELSKLKKRLKTAVRGHKLLKDKQDELMRQFILLIKENNRLRKEVEEKLMQTYKDFVLTGAIISPDFIEEAVMFPKRTLNVSASSKNIMSVEVPVLDFVVESKFEEDDIYSYGFSNTSFELDKSLSILSSIMPLLLKLAEVEKTCNLMTFEIQKTRRRVNALEYMTIPQLKETIKYITMKLEENERSALTRLMKVKSMITE